MPFVAKVLFGLLLAVTCRAQDDLAGWLAELRQKGDDTEPALVRKIADTGTRAAMEGLLAAYDSVGSILMHRELIRALAKFDGVADAEQPALEKIASIATSAEEPELRTAAIEALGGCAHLGRHFLGMIVDSDASDEVREAALKKHVQDASAADLERYRRIWNPEFERRKDKEGNIAPDELDAIRELAFAGLASKISEADLVATIRREEEKPKIRRAALAELHARNSPKTAEMAEWMFERVVFPGPDRSLAAKIMAEIEGEKAVDKFLALAKKKDVTSDDLRQTMADLIVRMKDEGVDKKLAGMIGKGKPHEQVFALLATRHQRDPKVLKKVRKELESDDLEVRRAAAQVLAAREDKESVPALHKLIEKPSGPSDVRIAIDAISVIEKGNKLWLAELVTLSRHADRDVRNAALEQVAAGRRDEQRPVLIESLTHEDWTTRLVAIEGLVAQRTRDAVGPLIDRLGVETGRMGRAVADGLWTLCGQPFDEDAARWKEWWKAQNQADFQVLTEKQLDKLQQEKELRRLKQRTKSDAAFFGIRIISHRVIFVIDTSGSMTEAVWGRFVGKRGATRIDIAKQELRQCIENLAPNALFNVLAFASGIGRWLPEGVATADGKARADALEWIDRLGAGGATNLYDSVKAAFADPDVDTIFVMSDGEPTAGEEIDPGRIREDVKFWNKHRHIEINTIAIGGNLEVLEWLAADSGGKHVRIR